MGAYVEVDLTTHPSEDESTALGLTENPRPPSAVSLGDRGTYESSWTIPTTGLDGTTRMQVAAESIFVALSDTVQVQVTTVGINPDLTELLAEAVVIR